MKASLPRVVFASGLLAALLAAQENAATPQAPKPQEPAKVVNEPIRPFDRARFEAEAKQLGATDAQLQAFAAQIERDGLTRAADDLVRAAVPAFDAAVKVREANDPAAALDLTKVLASAQHPLLAAHARYHLARVFLDSDDPERAVDVLNGYLSKVVNHSPLDAEVVFFYGQALAELPSPDDAIAWLKAFLQWFPEASERYRAAAHQQARELEHQRESRLHQLADGMKKTTRDLKKQKTDKPVQLDQEKYVQELQKLIEMYEEMEKQSSGPPSGTGPSAGPANKSQTVDGDGKVGDLQKRPTLADRWGDMKDREREKIEAGVRDGLPPQYQKMLEEYYKKLGQAGGTK